ncbi:hypothetical protein HZQ27_05180 [Elizabethkingia anophelis]|nr:hypothetical protein [Elizabethkingia anophelis]MCT3958501.1 hypothetical protein [Elizabethkingia anophelis]
MTYDRIDWHSEGDGFPKNISSDNGGTHIGMFSTWIIQNDLIGELHREESQESIEKVKNREMTGRDFLIKECDSKLWDEDLNEKGNRFAKYYFADNNGYKQYIIDYENLFLDYDNLYEIEDTWENYDRIRPVLDKRYLEWDL